MSDLDRMRETAEFIYWQNRFADDSEGAAMATCSNCRENEARYKVDSSLLCQPCLTDTQRGHNVSRLKGSTAPKIDLNAMQAFRRRVAGGEFGSGWLPALAAKVISAPTPTGKQFKPNFIDRTVNFVRRMFRTQRRG